MKITFKILLIICITSNAIGQESNAYRENITQFAKKNNAFAFKLFTYLKNQSKGNLFFSPFSIRNGMALGYIGSKEKTAEEISQIFYFDEDKSKLANGFQNILNKYRITEANAPKLKILNHLWVDNKVTLLNSYQNFISQNFNTSIQHLDFNQEPKKSRIFINHQIDSLTDHTISELFAPNDIKTLTRFITTNLIFLDAIWDMPFDSSQTYKDTFYDANQSIQQVEFMKAEMVPVNYIEQDTYQIVELPYQGRALGMLIILPKKGSDLSQLSFDLSTYYKKTTIKKGWKDIEQFAPDKKSLVFLPEYMDIILPKFKFKTDLDLKKLFFQMGLKSAFGPGADFSGMTDANDLLLNEIIHQTYLEVNENGTKAGATTAYEYTMRGISKKKTFKADRPFIFIIRDNSNGCILFMGKVTNPLLSN